MKKLSFLLLSLFLVSCSNANASESTIDTVDSIDSIDSIFEDSVHQDGESHIILVPGAEVITVNSTYFVDYLEGEEEISFNILANHSKNEYQGFTYYNAGGFRPFKTIAIDKNGYIKTTGDLIVGTLIYVPKDISTDFVVYAIKDGEEIKIDKFYDSNLSDTAFFHYEDADSFIFKNEGNEIIELEYIAFIQAYILETK